MEIASSSFFVEYILISVFLNNRQKNEIALNEEILL